MDNSADTNKGKRQAAAVNRAKALELRIAGFTYRDIASNLGVDVSTAYKYVQHSLNEVAEERKLLAANLCDMELARLDRLQSKLWAELTAVDNSPQQAPKYEIEKRCKIIDRILKIFVRRSRLLGLDAPKKFSHIARVSDLGNMSDEDLDAIINAGEPEPPAGA